jgi:hypothetical protein
LGNTASARHPGQDMLAGLSRRSSTAPRIPRRGR